MLSTSASKAAASAFLILASGSGLAGVEKSTANSRTIFAEVPIALDSTSMLVATLANGEIERHWMTREACERSASAVAAGEAVSGVLEDGVRITIASANCSTRRVEVDPNGLALNSAQAGER
jgi:hypothetical protein